MRAGITGVSIVAALVAAGWAWFALRQPADDAVLVLEEVVGDVTIEGQDVRRDAAVRDVLRANDVVSTAANGQAVLGFGPDSEIRVRPSSSLRVVSVSERDGAVFDLANGTIEATVRPSSGAVRVGSRGRTVESANGSFQVGVVEDLLQVHVDEGSVVLDGVDVPRADAGQDVLVVDQRGRVTPEAEALLLNVAWPPPTPVPANQVTVVGNTAPGAQVTFQADGVVLAVVRADNNGTFRADLPLATGGPRTIDVGVVDLLGRTGTSQGMLPPLRFEVNVVP